MQVLCDIYVPPPAHRVRETETGAHEHRSWECQWEWQCGHRAQCAAPPPHTQSQRESGTTHQSRERELTAVPHTH